MSILDRYKDLATCTYCGRRYKKHTLKPLINDDKPELNRKYCEECHPVVTRNCINLPWEK